MATNPYFNNMRQTNEQDLSHDLVEEIIQMTGMDVYYIKMNNVDSPQFDQIFGENRFEVLRNAILIEMYPRNFENPYQGGDMFSKMGITVANTIVFEVSYRRAEELIGGRPKEGDYIFLPATTDREMADMFKVMHVETDDEVWNPQGTILKYVLKCEQTTYGHQELKTGVIEIDTSTSPVLEDGLIDGTSDNELIQEISNMFIDFDEKHPFGKP